jgi:hypothetical protein
MNPLGLQLAQYHQMEINIFLDEILVNIIFRLDGKDRQNFSRTCKQLRSLIVAEHIRLIRNESKRLIGIFADIDAPFSESFKNDGLKFLNNQPLEVDSQFIILCCLFRLLRYYHVVQICICFLNDECTKKYDNVFVSIAFAIFQSSENYSKGDDSKFVCLVLSTLLPDFKLGRVSTHREIVKMFNHIHPLMKQRAIQKLDSFKNTIISFVPLISQVLSIKLPFYNNKSVSEQLSEFGVTYRFCHNDFKNFTQEQIKQHVRFYRDYNFDGTFSIVLPLSIITPILADLTQHEVDIQFETLYPLLTEWFRLNCSIFYTFSEFVSKIIGLFKRVKQNSKIGSLNWPASMLNHHRTGLIKWAYNDAHMKYLFSGLIYFIPQKQVIPLIEQFDFLHVKSDEQIARRLASLSFDEREFIINFLKKPLIEQFSAVYKISPQIIMNIYLDNPRSDQHLSKVLVNYHIVNFILSTTNSTKIQILNLMMQLSIENIDKLHSLLIDFYFDKISKEETRKLMCNILHLFV